MSPAAIFKRALAEKLAFTPMNAQGPAQAAGPGGAPVDPAAGAPMDPAAAGGAPPMDPAAGMPSMDPAAGGMPPMDPAAAGAPMDPAAGGMPPMDPAAAGGAPPMDAPPELPPAPEEPDKDPIDEQAKAQKELGIGDAMVPLSQLKEFTVGVIEATKGKKTQEAAAREAKEEEAAPAGPTGSVTGLPGFDPSAIGGPLKTAADSVFDKYPDAKFDFKDGHFEFHNVDGRKLSKKHLQELIDAGIDREMPKAMAALGKTWPPAKTAAVLKFLLKR